jgi:hypothetical protein
MTSQELTHAAATIASGMVAQVATRGQIEESTMKTIARTAVELVRQIEDAARKAYSAH